MTPSLNNVIFKRPIAHVDVQFGQFFRGTDGLIKIIDFNRAEALLYDVEKEKYCVSLEFIYTLTIYS